jgi:uncharacterized protein YacL
MIFQFLRSLLVLTGTIVGVAVGYATASEYENIVEVENPEITLAALLGFIGYLICSMAGRELQIWLEDKIEKTNSYELAWSGLGVLAGLVSANLLFIPVYFIMYKGFGEIKFDNKYINSLVPLFHLVIPLAFNLLFAYLGMKILIRYRKFQVKVNANMSGTRPKVIDTSAVIDGRFSDLFRLGFLEGDILIPRFVINELQFLADSSDDLKREKGRKGLVGLTSLQKEFPDHVVIHEKDFKDTTEVDAKLVKLASELKAVLITQDYNLKKVAELDKVNVLNLNDLANALKPIFLSGEALEVKIVKTGKEPCQGVAFLSDGTMVVVEDGGNKVGETVSTTVSNILQTASGRMIFTRIGKK